MKSRIISRLSCNSIILASFWLLTGCSQPEPAGPVGGFSVVHQKCLTMAAERAMSQGDLTPERFASKRVLMRLDSMGSNDMGSNCVCESVKGRIRKTASSVVEDGNVADSSVSYRVQLAGCDVSKSAFLGFSTVKTTAEVKLGFTYKERDGRIDEREGSGTARHKQSKWLGIPIGEKYE